MIIYLTDKPTRRWKTISGTYIFTKDNVDWYAGNHDNYFAQEDGFVWVVGVFNDATEFPPNMVRFAFNSKTFEVSQTYGNDPHEYEKYLPDFKEAVKVFVSLEDENLPF